ncbi:guanine nucleotide-binding protein G(s) subunit alpha-like [Physella acuta]|uniref:guanine nucleotide-binding protein G(s) subunit alpha-like n=1 Tax=Physella acuta TaxID=109671 RepID=UPI0027DB3A15|nr:guanine nucleotide-binding protein G(s) subunit alpha-like [Physella acuta]
MMACCGVCVSDGEEENYSSRDEAKNARRRNHELTKLLKKQHAIDTKRLRLLLLGASESGKSTITKQMKIIHINGYTFSERLEKIKDINRNVRESMLSIVVAMQLLSISLEREENKTSFDFILTEAAKEVTELSEVFWDHCKSLWADAGVQHCYNRSHEYQLIDSAKYFLDKIDDIRRANYVPSDQDILRARAITTNIQHIEFQVADGNHMVKFCVYDVGGQRGERKKWIQVFDNVVAILFLSDTSSFDLTLREDQSKNRLMESLQIFEQVWNNRFLRPVSILLFLNKIDILTDKISRGRSIRYFLDQHPGIFPDYDEFEPTANEKTEFLESLPAGPEPPTRKRGRLSSRTDVNPEAIKTAVYIKYLFTKIVGGTLELNKTLQHHNREWHQSHSCACFYTCAVDTNNVKKVLEGCRTLIVRKYLERFGII